MGFQILWSILVFFAISRLCVQFHKKHINRFYFFVFLIVWSVVLILSWDNSLLDRFGDLMGIDRGSTILVYVALFILFYYMFMSMIKMYKMERDIDRLVKKEAVEGFQEKYKMEVKQ